MSFFSNFFKKPKPTEEKKIIPEIKPVEKKVEKNTIKIKSKSKPLSLSVVIMPQNDEFALELTNDLKLSSIIESFIDEEIIPRNVNYLVCINHISRKGDLEITLAANNVYNNDKLFIYNYSDFLSQYGGEEHKPIKLKLRDKKSPSPNPVNPLSFGESIIQPKEDFSSDKTLITNTFQQNEMGVSNEVTVSPELEVIENEIRNLQSEPESIENEVQEEISEPEIIENEVQEEIPEPEVIENEVQEEIPEPEIIENEVWEEVSEQEVMENDVQEEIPEPEIIENDVQEEISEPEIIENEVWEEVSEQEVMENHVQEEISELEIIENEVWEEVSEQEVMENDVQEEIPEPEVIENEVWEEVSEQEVVENEVQEEISEPEVVENEVQEEISEPEVVENEVQEEISEPEVVENEVQEEISEPEVVENEVQEEISEPEVVENEVQEEISEPEVVENEVQEEIPEPEIIPEKVIDFIVLPSNKVFSFTIHPTTQVEETLNAFSNNENADTFAVDWELFDKKNQVSFSESNNLWENLHDVDYDKEIIIHPKSKNRVKLPAYLKIRFNNEVSIHTIESATFSTIEDLGSFLIENEMIKDINHNQIYSVSLEGVNKDSIPIVINPYEEIGVEVQKTDEISLVLIIGKDEFEITVPEEYTGYDLLKELIDLDLIFDDKEAVLIVKALSGELLAEWELSQPFSNINLSKIKIEVVNKNAKPKISRGFSESEITVIIRIIDTFDEFEINIAKSLFPSEVVKEFIKNDIIPECKSGDTPYNYEIYNKSIGDFLDPRLSIERNGVKPDHILIIL